MLFCEIKEDLSAIDDAECMLCDYGTSLGSDEFARVFDGECI